MIAVSLSALSFRADEKTTHTPSAWDAHTYRGQVTLVPPTSMTDYNVSRSYGAVIVRESDAYNTWRYISVDLQVKQEAADTMCREMGFTHAVMNTVANLSTSEYIYGYQYHFTYM